MIEGERIRKAIITRGSDLLECARNFSGVLGFRITLKGSIARDLWNIHRSPLYHGDQWVSAHILARARHHRIMADRGDSLPPCECEGACWDCFSEYKFKDDFVLNCKL